MRGATLFSGILAPETAAPWIDWRWCAEIDPFACAVLKHRHSGVPNLGDVTSDTFIARAVHQGPIDILVFGSPCQSFSVAGNRAGLDDARGNLALVALSIVRALRPTWFLFENVPGLLSSWSGEAESLLEIGTGEREGDAGSYVEESDFAAFLCGVEECGYSGAWASPDAQWFGVPQRRERIFFVGHSGDWRGPAAVLSELHCMQGNSPTRSQAGEGVAGTLGGGSGDHGRCSDTDRMTFVPILETVATLDANYGKLQGASGQDLGHGHSHLIAFDTTQLTSKANRSNPQSGDPCHPLASCAHPPTIAFSCKDHGADVSELSPTLRSMGHDESHANAGGQVAVAFRACGQEGFTPSEVAPPVTSTDGGGSGVPTVAFNLRGREGGAMPESTDLASVRSASGGSSRTYVGGMAVRRLTPTECEKLQGLPPGHTLVPYRGKLASDGPRYRSIGNSMAVPVVAYLLERIAKVDGILNP